MEKMSLYELYRILENVRSSDYKFETIEYIENIISEKERVLEDTSATGGPASVGYGGGGVSMGNATTAGMGGVVSSQPSAFPGALNGVAWASGGGTKGSGDISIPYNPSGANRMFQKLPVMGKNHKSQTGKKSRQKPLNIKSLKDIMANKGKSSGKIMNFNDFDKKDVTTKVTKVKE